MKEQRWNTIKRILAVLMAIFFWGLSIIFSQKGFGISLPTWAWAGWVLAMGVTILELILNSGTRMNPTIYIAGIIAYMYGIGTNVYGIVMARTGMDGIMVWDWVLAVIVGLLLEVVPEPVFLYGIGIDVGDLITTLLSGVHGRSNHGRVQKYRPEPLVDTPLSNGQDTRQDVQDVRVDNRGQQDSWTNGKTARMVRGYLHAHPGASVRQVADGIRQPPSSIGVIMKKMRDRGEIRN